MPELPEVEVIVRRLRPLFEGKTLTSFRAISKKAVKTNPQTITKAILNQELRSIQRRGKAIILEFPKGFLIIHLKINGQICLDTKQPAYALVELGFEGAEKHLYVCDRRGLAEVRFTTDLDKEAFFRQMGPDVLDEAFTLEYFRDKVKRSRTKIKPLLMDQKFVAGIGNIYAVEALFRARIRPDRPANSLSEEEIERLYNAVREVVKDSIRHGAVLKKYFYDGKSHPDFSGKLLVYGRENEPCAVCGGKVVKVTLGGRGTYYCPVCQA